MKYHLVGIGGIGMSGLAKLLLEKNREVSGSDPSTNEMTHALQELGAKITSSQDGAFLTEEKTVVISSSIKKENKEYQAAKEMGCSIIHRSDLLKELAKGKKCLSVTGTHGKTTTSSLLSWVLLKASYHPSFSVGGVIGEVNSNAKSGTGEYFVIEADESDGTHVKYDTYGGIITNLGNDHIDHYGSFENLSREIERFGENVKETLIWCGDDPKLKALSLKGMSYGFTDQVDWKGKNFSQNGFTLSFDAEYQGKTYRRLTLPLIGLHNAKNALAVFALALSVGVSEEKIRDAFLTFPGVSRRLEKKHSPHKILWLDDYAHHPTEIRSTLKSLKEAVFGRRVVAVFEPHRYSRMKECLELFDGAFDHADQVFITDLYEAGEQPIEGVSGKIIAEKVNGIFLPRENLANIIHPFLKPHDVVVTMGAGGITYLHRERVGMSEKKLKVGVLMGGRSPEHEISKISALSIVDQMEGYEPHAIEIPRDETIGQAHLEKMSACDIIFPALHGPNGEDGTVQGLLELLELPYVGCGPLASAIAMDKIKCKQLLASFGLPVAPFLVVKQTMNRCDIPFPLFVKAPTLGSSIGVYRVTTLEELNDAISSVLQLDDEVLIEKEVVGRELEFAVLGNDAVTVYGPGEVFVSPGKPYLLDVKYGKNSLATKQKAELSEEVRSRGKRVAQEAYKKIGCQGLCRVDLFLQPNGQFLINELNPMPGFTKTSLFPKICESENLSFSQLIDQLVILALEKHRKKERKKSAQREVKIPI